MATKAKTVKSAIENATASRKSKQKFRDDFARTGKIAFPKGTSAAYRRAATSHVKAGGRLSKAHSKGVAAHSAAYGGA